MGCGVNALEEVLEADPSLFKKPGPKLGYQALGRQQRHCVFEIGKRLDQFAAKVVEFGVSLANVHVAPLASRT